MKGGRLEDKAQELVVIEVKIEDVGKTVGTNINPIISMMIGQEVCAGIVLSVLHLFFITSCSFAGPAYIYFIKFWWLSTIF